MNVIPGSKRSRLIFLVGILLLVFGGIFPAGAATPGQMLIQVNSINSSVIQGQPVTITGTAPQVSAQQIQVWVVTGSTAQVTGTAITFSGSFAYVVDTTSLAPGTYGVVLAAPYNGNYPVTYNSSLSSAVITTTGQPIYQFTDSSTTDGPTVANTIVTTCSNVGADTNCVPLSFTVLPVATTPTPVITVPATAVPVTPATTKKAPLPAFFGIGALGIGALLLAGRRP